MTAKDPHWSFHPNKEKSNQVTPQLLPATPLASPAASLGLRATGATSLPTSKWRQTCAIASQNNICQSARRRPAIGGNYMYRYAFIRARLLSRCPHAQNMWRGTDFCSQYLFSLIPHSLQPPASCCNMCTHPLSGRARARPLFFLFHACLGALQHESLG